MEEWNGIFRFSFYFATSSRGVINIAEFFPENFRSIQLRFRYFPVVLVEWKAPRIFRTHVMTTHKRRNAHWLI